MSKIKTPKPPAGNPSISNAKQQAEQKATELINFSFKYLDNQHHKFTYGSHNGGYFVEVINRIKEICKLTKLELLANRSAALRAHPITWNSTSEERFGFPKEDEIVDTPYQFSIASNEHGRVHGFFIYNTFYVVWFDKNHQLYP